MTFIDRLRYLFSSKASEARMAMSMMRLGQPVNTPANYLAMSKEGYQKNAVVYRCVKMISTTCAGINWELYRGKGENKTEIEQHPLLSLMERPNPMQAWSAFFEGVVSYLCLSGNTYVEGVSPGSSKAILEMWTLRPDLMTIVPNSLGYAGEYRFKTGGAEKVWKVDPVTMMANVMHAKTFHPVDIWYGMSPMEAAILGVDQLNQANRWNLALLQNSASPSGVLKVIPSDANPTGSLTSEQYSRLQNDFLPSHTGSTKIARPMLLEGGLDWQSIAMSPKEMEWLNGKSVTAIDICNVFGVPAQMLGLGQSTYANYEQAREAFYDETILPLMDFFADEFNRWLVPRYGDDLKLCYDKDDIEALVDKRQRKISSIVPANFLTQNEKREAVGYEPVKGWDVFVVGNQILANPNEWTNFNEPPQDMSEAEGGSNGQSSEETSQEDREENQTSSEEIVEESDKGWKQFNLLNNREKQTTWRRVNAARKRLEKPFARALEADFQELASKLSEAINSTDPRTSEYAMNLAIDEGMKDIEKTLRRHIKFSVMDFGQNVFQSAKNQHIVLETKKSEKTWNDWAEHFVKTRTAKAITEVEGTTRKQVRRVVQDLVTQQLSEDAEPVQDMANQLQNRFKDLSGGRARTIARTEVGMASNNATLEAAKSLEVPGLKKEWVSLQDDRTRDGDGPNLGAGPDHKVMNGVPAELDEKFTVPPDTDMDGPGDPSAGPEQICNCRCTLVFRATR